MSKLFVNVLLLLFSIKFFKQFLQEYHQSQMGLDMRKPVFRGLGTIKAQASLRSFVIHFLESIIFKLATWEISIF